MTRYATIRQIIDAFSSLVQSKLAQISQLTLEKAQLAQSLATALADDAADEQAILDAQAAAATAQQAAVDAQTQLADLQANFAAYQAQRDAEEADIEAQLQAALAALNASGGAGG